MWEEISELLTNEDGQQYTAYGISGADCRISDVTTDRTVIQTLLELFNRNNVSPIHAFELVEDFLVELLS